MKSERLTAHKSGESMANEEQLAILRQGRKAWNEWRREHLFETVVLNGANLIEADLSAANLVEAYLIGADFVRAKLSGADLRCAILTGTNLANADLTDIRAYGISVWNTNLEGAIQKDILIADEGEPKITVDNLEVAQFIYLLLTNEKIRDVIDTITTKVVLILGRFTPDRKAVLDALREHLRQMNLSPVLFDFEKPKKKDFTETVKNSCVLVTFCHRGPDGGTKRSARADCHRPGSRDSGVACDP
jgi:hypothetical protein